MTADACFFFIIFLVSLPFFFLFWWTCVRDAGKKPPHHDQCWLKKSCSKNARHAMNKPYKDKICTVCAGPLRTKGRLFRSLISSLGIAILFCGQDNVYSIKEKSSSAGLLSEWLKFCSRRRPWIWQFLGQGQFGLWLCKILEGTKASR